MMDYLFSLLLVPLMPSLANPEVTHSEALTTLEQRLEQGRQATLNQSTEAMVPAEPARLNTEKDALPVITGRVFEWSSRESADVQTQNAALGRFAESLRFTGEIESSGQRVAILNDGEQDHVVAVGSYVLNSYQVTALGQGTVVLMPLDGWSGGKRLELKLMPGFEPGGL